MSVVEDSILDPFVEYLMKEAEKKCLNNVDLLECVREARKKMREDHLVKTMEAALEGQIVVPVPYMKVSDQIGIYELENPNDPPAVGEKVGFGRNGAMKAVPGMKGPRGFLISIEPGGLTAQVMLDRRR
jgi:hypothetical protein